MEDLRPLSFEPRGERDRLFQKEGFPKKFEFNEDVARVFDDMVLRSIPLYEDVLNAAIIWTKEYYQEHTKIYDLGCSTGSTIYALAATLPQRLNIIGIDNSHAMINMAREKLRSYEQKHQIELCLEDLQNAQVHQASVVIMNYTLQFLPVLKRKALLQRIYEGLKPGGILFLSEKIRSSSPIFQETITSVYEGFKLRNGYSRTEIEHKKEALDNVLIPFTTEEHHSYLTEVGFNHSEIILRWNNFATLVAIKQ